MTKTKQKLKKRPTCCSPSYPLAQTNDANNCTPPDLELELQALRKQDKLSPTDDTKHAILSSCAAKPYTRQKDEVFNAFLCCLSLQPGSQWENLLKPRVVCTPTQCWNCLCPPSNLLMLWLQDGPEAFHRKPCPHCLEQYHQEEKDRTQVFFHLVSTSYSKSAHSSTLWPVE